MDFYKLSRIGLKSRWDKQYNFIRQNIQNNHHNLLKEKARIIGFIMGDGSITKDDSSLKGGHHDIKFYPDDKDIAYKFMQDFEKLYLKKPSIKKLENYFVIHVS